MQCLTQLIPPSGVTHALSVPFTSSDASNLVVARTSLLQIFTHKQVNNGQDTKLILVAEYNLSGTVTALGRVNVPNSKCGGNAVLVALRDAKLSLIEWDPAMHSISTLSIHYYENHDLQAAPWMPNLAECVSHLTVDPSSRCAAFNFGVSNLAIIPFHQAADDLALDDFDNLDGDTEMNGQSSSKQMNGSLKDHTTPYAPSFVLPLTVLDPGLLHPVDMAFLHEYRDPTIGMLYSTAARSSNMSAERRDVTIYSVYALDLEQKASTTLQSVQRLPNDLYRIIPLPLPVGGALLVGGNELIHVDQSGKSTAVAVNEFARESSSFSMADQSEVRMKLEGCRIQQVGNANGDMLIILNNGDTALLTFRMDGRSVSGILVHRIYEDHISAFITGAASCIENVGAGRLFIGSEESDSVLISTAKKAPQLKRLSSKVQGQPVDDGEDDDGDEDEDEDDLYGDIAKANGVLGDIGAVAGQNFRLLDRLSSIAPIRDMAFGKPGKRKRDDQESSGEELEPAIAYGQGRAGGVAFLSQGLQPKVLKRTKYEDAISVWSLKPPYIEPQAAGASAATQANHHYRHQMIVSLPTNDGVGRSTLVEVVDGTPTAVEGDNDFDVNAGYTIAVGRLEATNHTAQVTPAAVRVYNSEYELVQIVPIVEEDEGQTAKAISASFAGPCIMLVKDDGRMMLLKADKRGELDELELPDNLADTKVLSAGLYHDASDFFQTSRLYSGKSSLNLMLVILTEEGHFLMLSLPNINLEIFRCESLPFLPTYLMQGGQLPKHWRTRDELAEALLTDLGDTVDRRPHLVLRTQNGDIIVYDPYAIPDVVGSYMFKKVATKAAPNRDDEEEEEEGEEVSDQSLRQVRNVSGHDTVFITGPNPSIIVKTACTMPRIYSIHTQHIKSVTSINTRDCRDGVIFIDDMENMIMCQLPLATLGLSDWVVEKVPLGQDVTNIAYFEPTDSYVIATNQPTQFQLPQDDEWHQEWQSEATKFLPSTSQSSLKLMSSKTNSIVSQYDFEPCERVLSVKCLNLEVSEETHERRDLIVVGTALVKGENVTTRGNLYIFDAVRVVPWPDIPESDLKLKMITKEDVRGAVSAICDVGSQGFVMAAQGQKCMVRGLKEDMSILPVAFVDTRYYIHVAKELRGTGLCILGDAFSGLWMMGYSEEPYKLQILGQDLENPEVIAAEFLPDGKQLYILSSDGNGVIRVLQYDPEDPKTDRGTKLLLRSTFNSGAMSTSMTLVPQTRKPQRSVRPDAMDVDSDSPTSTVMLTTQAGSICLIKPLPEPTYRRLSTLQNTLLTSLDFHPCSLNPRAYRQVETDGVGGRGIIDGDFVVRWWETSTQQRVNSADKAGGNVWEVRGDMEIIRAVELGV